MDSLYVRVKPILLMKGTYRPLTGERSPSDADNPTLSGLRTASRQLGIHSFHQGNVF